MKLYQPLVLLMMLPALLSAKPLTKGEIINLGTRAYQQKAQLIHPQASNSSLKYYDLLDNNGDVDMAVLHFEEGFLILSADDAYQPILAYSFEGDMDIDNTTPAIWVFLSQYRTDIAAIRRLALTATPEIQEEWDALRQPDRSTLTEVVVAPLIRSKWNQNKYYNALCPEDPESPSGYDGRVPNGCVAVAMSQIIFYYRYPESGNGSHTNYTEYGSFHVNFSQQHYNYNSMCDELHNYNNEVAKLIFHCGTAVNMMYGSDGSGAYSGDVPAAMSTYFKYTPDATYRSKHNYSTSAWNQMLINDLNEKYPIYYSGYSQEGGHAFICDGYNSDQFFHFNFGWGGSGNGYYYTSNNDTIQNAVNGYDYGQSAIFDLYPMENHYPTYCQGSIITAANGTLEDGSGPFDYTNNSHCTYIITNPTQTSVSVTIQTLATQEGQDLLKFWDRNPSNGNLLTVFSGSLPSSTSQTFNTDSLYITFDTDDSITDAGWRLSFESNRTGNGCGMTVSQHPTGTFSDNNDGSNYMDNSECAWVIRVSNAEFITFTFEEFNLKPEDHVAFYDMQVYPNELLDWFTGSDLPDPVTYFSNKIIVRFQSDNDMNDTGFRISWFASGTGIDNTEMVTTLYPNPASDVLHITFSEPVENGIATIYDIVGNLVLIQDIQSSNSIEIPVHQLSNGIYMLSLKNGERTIHKKIMINH